MARTAEAPKLKQHGNGVWYIHYRENGRGERVSTRTRSLQEAQQVFAGWLSGEKETAAEQEGLRTVQCCWDRYTDQHVNKKVVDKERIEFAGKNLMAHFGKMFVRDIESADIDSYVEKRRAGDIGRKSQDATIRRELNALIACFNFNLKKVEPKDLRLNHRDIPHIDLPDHSDPRDRVLSTKELNKIQEATDEKSRLGLYIRLLIATGARKTALLDLRWDQIDFEHGIIKLNPMGRKQTKKRRPTVPMTPRLQGILERAKEHQDKKKPSAFVLGHNGEIQMSVTRLMERLKLKGVTSHVFRHTFITRRIQEGVPYHAVAEMVGDTVETIVRNYQHLSPDYLKQFQEDTDLKEDTTQ